MIVLGSPQRQQLTALRCDCILANGRRSCAVLSTVPSFPENGPPRTSIHSAADHRQPRGPTAAPDIRECTAVIITPPCHSPEECHPRGGDLGYAHPAAIRREDGEVLAPWS